MMTKHNILVVDDHRITQSGLRYLFASLDRYAVVGTLDRGATVNAFVQSQPVDLVILDLNLPDVRGVNVTPADGGNRFEAIPLSVPFRPERRTPKPLSVPTTKV